MKFLISILFLYSFNVQARFLPTDIELQDSRINYAQVKENKKMVRAVIRKFQRTFGKEAFLRGGKISINDVWWSKTFNAYAMKYGPIWKITVHGGLLKHPDLTEDLLSLVLCHELGHFLGGAPKFTTPGKRWSSVEGQADYWTGQRCLKRIFDYDKSQKSKILDLDPLAKNQCDKTYRTAKERLTCYRVTMTGLQMGYLIADLTGKKHPSLDTPDPNVVDQTYKDHPNFQCRVDTYFHAALCPAEGKISDQDVKAGTCLEGEFGPRPACWFSL